MPSPQANHFAASRVVVETKLWGQTVWLQIWVLSYREMIQYFSASASYVCRMGINTSLTRLLRRWN